MKKEIINYVESELKNYKKNKAVYNSIILEHNITISAQVLSDMPKSITNKFSSVTENQAIYNRLSEIEKELKRVENWLDRLQDKERFVITNFYFENKTYTIIAHKWSIAGNPIYTSQHWKTLRKRSLIKICEVFVESFLINT